MITNKTYNQLFQTEAVIGPDALKIRDLTFFFSDLKGSTALYERIGDIKAFSLVQSHFEKIAKVIKEYNGYFVKTIGDAIMAVFLNANDAFVASRLILEVIAEFNRRHHSNDILLKIGIQKANVSLSLGESILEESVFVKGVVQPIDILRFHKNTT
ncbi:adenylate/guanylate cyclase domain-containing protein [Leptospira yanagawae]|uniref:adenylate/guanylate cyclase domain-containing protein n=1 Tax=Leptospira yanagawae TaxID=293069 RepID=UPI001ABFADCA|nr:adenylate/guanylate cyclase domain-containing protein [Leptospira yanagawae]